MPSLVAILGPAGTGKTTRLLESVGEYASRLVTEPQQRLLAMSFMNGARLRLDLALRAAYPNIPRTVITLDKLASTIVNRWRQAEHLTFPVASSKAVGSAGSGSLHFRTHLSFDQIVQRAGRLLERPAVIAWVSSSFPLILVDEFQDCVDVRLAFVQNLSIATQVLVAADEFQLLNDEYSTTCPAVEWIECLETSGNATVVRLTATHRTDAKPLLDAASALRNNVAASADTIPVICAPGYGLLASRCMYFMLSNSSKKAPRPTWAFLTPSLNEASIRKLLNSLDKQLALKTHNAIPWKTQSADLEQAVTFAALGIESDSAADAQVWKRPTSGSDALTAQVCERVTRFARLRGLAEITHGLVRQFAEVALHGRAAYVQRVPRFLLTTIHGAKNREFDNVIIFWGFKLPADSVARRKLLYNAVTRAKRHAILLILDPGSRGSTDPVLRLLGTPAVFKPKAGRGSGKRKAKLQ